MSQLSPPKGFDSWLEYAIATMDTRILYVESCMGDSHWGREVQRDEMREAALAELAKLKGERHEK